MTSSEFNPYYDRLAPLYGQRTTLEVQLQGLVTQLRALSQFDFVGAISAVEENDRKALSLTQDAYILKGQIDEADRAIALGTEELDSLTVTDGVAATAGGSVLGTIAALGLGRLAGLAAAPGIGGLIIGLGGAGVAGFQVFVSHKRKQEQAKSLADAVMRRDVLAAAFDQQVSTISQIHADNSAVLRALREKHEIDTAPMEAALARLDLARGELSREIEDLEGRRDRLNASLETLPSDIERDRRELLLEQAKHERLKAIALELKNIDRKAPGAGRKRAGLHDEVRALADKPSDPLDYANDDMFRNAGDPITQAQSVKGRLDYLGRRLTKNYDRAVEIKQLAEIRIETILIDGNNLCYEYVRGKRRFAGAGAVKAIARWFRMNRPDAAVKVAFDPGICAQLGKLRAASTGENAIALEPSEIENYFEGLASVTLMHGKADKTILPAANKPCVYVISNDNFDDYRSQAVVRERRVLRYNLFNGTITVPNLDLAAPYAVEAPAPGARSKVEASV